MTTAPVVGPVPAATPWTLTIGLSVKDPDVLRDAAARVSDPKSASYRKYVTPAQFADRFGATPAEYRALLDWARSKNLAVTAHPNRVVATVSGTAGDIGTALGVHLNYGTRPDGTQFFAPYVEPSIDLAVPIQHIGGLENFALPRSAGDSGAKGSYQGTDFRHAYAAGTTLTGWGQTIGIADFGGEVFAPSDIDEYARQIGQSFLLPIQSDPPNTGTTQGTGAAVETTGDIEMALSMAPAAQIVVFTTATNNHDEILANMAARPDIKQFTSSLVGGSSLNMSNGGASYGTLETVWSDWADRGGSGGIESSIGIPAYQARIAGNNGASSTNRNVPDVSAEGRYVNLYYNKGPYQEAGTSMSTPLWAGFMALVNQQAAMDGSPSIGFANPALYTIAAATPNALHDIVSGCNPNGTGFQYCAGSGYDLATGLGSPTSSLIRALLDTRVAPPNCTYTPTGNKASNNYVDYITVACVPDPANDPIYIFRQSGTGAWTHVDYYQDTVAGGHVMFGVNGTTEVFLACTWNSTLAPSQTAWARAVVPESAGCDAPTPVVVPACVPLTSSACGPNQCGLAGILDGCGGQVVCPPCPCRPANCGNRCDTTLSDGCGGTLHCGNCVSGLTCTENQCRDCRDTFCESDYYWNAAACECELKWNGCACGGVYPKCKVCR